MSTTSKISISKCPSIYVKTRDVSSVLSWIPTHGLLKIAATNPPPLPLSSPPHPTHSFLQASCLFISPSVPSPTVMSPTLQDSHVLHHPSYSCYSSTSFIALLGLGIHQPMFISWKVRTPTPPDVFVMHGMCLCPMTPSKHSQRWEYLQTLSCFVFHRQDVAHSYMKL